MADSKRNTKTLSILDASVWEMSQTYATAPLYDSPRVDQSTGVLRGVAVMTMGEVPDRGTYVDMKTLKMLKACCDQYVSGVKVKADHGSGVFGTTAYLKNFRIMGNKLTADLYVLDSDANRGKLMEMAQEIPDTFGLSVSIEQEIEEVDGRCAIRPLSVDSVDLVTEPAANPAGLFSRQKPTRQVDANHKHKSAMSNSEKYDDGDALAKKKAKMDDGDLAKKSKMDDGDGSDSLAKKKAKMDDDDGGGDFDDDGDSSGYDDDYDDLKKNFDDLKKKFDDFAGKVWPDSPPANMAGSGRPARPTGLFRRFSRELQSTREEFAKKLEENRTETVKSVAAEFSKVIGQSVVKVGADSAAADAAAKKETETSTADAFEARVQEAYEKTKSKTEAMSIAVREDMKASEGKGHQAFIARGKSVRYSK